MKIMSKGKVLLGLLTGVAVGAALGILFAPDKGWNTRKRISKKAEDLANDLREKFDEFIDMVSVKVDEAKSKASDMADKAKEKADEVKNEARTAKS
jgi:gas vesicle protein